MKPPSSKLQQNTEHTLGISHAGEASQVRHAATAEELLRHDAALNPVPPAIAQRLNESIAKEPKPEKPWWKKIFRGE